MEFQEDYCSKEELITMLSGGVKYREGVLKMPRVKKEFLNDKDVVLQAVMNNGLNLKDASKKLKDDFDVVKSAVIEDWNALEYVPKYQGNRELMLEIVKNNGFLFYMSTDLLKDVAFLEQIIEINPDLYNLIFGENHKFIPKGLKGIKKVDFNFEEADEFIRILKIQVNLQ